MAHFLKSTTSLKWFLPWLVIEPGVALKCALRRHLCYLVSVNCRENQPDHVILDSQKIFHKAFFLHNLLQNFRIFSIWVKIYVQNMAILTNL